MASGIMLDTRQFDAAMVQYAAASKKDFKDIANKRVFDTALRSAKYAPVANKNAIMKNVSKKNRNLVWWLANKVYIPRGWKKMDAYEEAEKHLRNRVKAINFIKSFFVKMASKMAPHLNPPMPVKAKGKGTYNGFTPIVIPATSAHPVATLGIQYNYEKRSAATAKKTESILMRTLMAGMTDATADMMKYVNGKMGKTAKKFSARGAR